MGSTRGAEALKRFHEQVEDGKEIAKRAKGLLTLPNFGKGALIVGFEYGRGALRVGGKTKEVSPECFDR